MSESPITTAQVASLLKQSLGEEKAGKVVEDAAVKMGLRLRDGMTRDDALQILETLAGEQGLVGIAARFAKSRAILVFPPRS